MKEIHVSMTRLYNVAKMFGFNGQSAVGHKLNVSPQVMRNWEIRGISEKGARQAHQVFGCSPNWVTEGKGNFFADAFGYKFTPGGFYETAGLGYGDSLKDDEVVIMNLAGGNQAIMIDWLGEARAFHKWRNDIVHGVSKPYPQQPMTTGHAVRESSPVAYLPAKDDPLITEMLQLFHQLDEHGKKEWLADLRGFVRGRRPHPHGAASTVAVK